jgi:hypothetical protein
MIMPKQGYTNAGCKGTPIDKDLPRKPTATMYTKLSKRTNTQSKDESPSSSQECFSWQYLEETDAPMMSLKCTAITGTIFIH